MIVLGISGSLQSASSNTGLIDLARAEAPEGIEVRISTPIGEIPHFNPDLDVEPVPPAVGRLRDELAAADGVLLASPEYAHGMPGSLKNALDWMVGSGHLYEKRVAVLVGSPRAYGGTYARDWIMGTLGAQGAVIVSSATVGVRRGAESMESALHDPAVIDAVVGALEALRSR